MDRGGRDRRAGVYIMQGSLLSYHSNFFASAQVCLCSILLCNATWEHDGMCGCGVAVGYVGSYLGTLPS